MTQAIDKHIIQENILLDKFRNLTSEQQQTILDFVEFMYRKKTRLPENKEVSAYDLAKEWAGSVESGIGELSTKLNYNHNLTNSKFSMFSQIWWMKSKYNIVIS
jgi:hypothetical protein